MNEDRIYKRASDLLKKEGMSPVITYKFLRLHKGLPKAKAVKKMVQLEGPTTKAVYGGQRASGKGRIKSLIEAIKF